MLIGREELKEKLNAVKDNECKVSEGVDAFTLALAMMEYLGDRDSELRDDLIYSILIQWITSGVFTKEQRKHILSTVLDEKHLFHKIGETDTDSVFMRAFSMLITAGIVYAHREDKFLTHEVLTELKNKVIKCMEEEQDVRGYIVNGGWAHTAAHSSDALDELALCEEFGYEELLEILEAIKKKVSIGYHAYICYEDERLALATNSLINRGLLSEEEIAEWIKSFAEYDKSIEFPNHYYLIANIRNYLNCLYYRLPGDQYHAIKEAISGTILSIRRF